MKKLLFVLSIAFLLQTISFAQEQDSTATQTETADSTALTFWKKHDVNFAAVPMINYDPSLGWNFAALTNAFFKVSTKDTISPLSMAGAMVGYTTNESWYWAIYTKLYLDKDNYRLTIGYGDASINFQHYDHVGGSYIDFNSLNNFFLSEVQRRIYKRWYAGLRYVSRQTTTTFDGQPSGEKNNLSNIGAVLSHDTRDLIYNPHMGDYFNVKTGHYRETWGSAYNYNSLNIDFTKFLPISEDKTLALRATALIAYGDSVPFEGQNVVGREDIRGYTKGQHRANQTHNIQAEYRWNFYKKWGMVAFGGVATSVNKVNEINFKDLLPAAGVGLRFMAIPSEKINIGIDVAKGIDDWGLYFRIGETFGDK